MERIPSQILLQLRYLLYRILVTLGVLFFLTWSFFPKEGFGQGVFNEAPQIS